MERNIVYGKRYEETKHMGLEELFPFIIEEFRKIGLDWHFKLKDSFGNPDTKKIFIRILPIEWNPFNKEMTVLAVKHRDEKWKAWKEWNKMASLEFSKTSPFTLEATELINALNELLGEFNYDGSDTALGLTDQRFYGRVQWSKLVDDLVYEKELENWHSHPGAFEVPLKLPPKRSTFGTEDRMQEVLARVRSVALRKKV